MSSVIPPRRILVRIATSIDWLVLHFSALDDRHVLIRLVVGGASILDHPNDFHTVNHLPKNNMLTIQERCWGGGDEELTSVRIRAGVLIYQQFLVPRSLKQLGPYCHTQQSGPVMLDNKILIGEFRRPVDGARPRTVALDKIASLDHEILNLNQVSLENCRQLGDIAWRHV